MCLNQIRSRRGFTYELIVHASKYCKHLHQWQIAVEFGLWLPSCDFYSQYASAFFGS